MTPIDRHRLTREVRFKSSGSFFGDSIAKVFADEAKKRKKAPTPPEPKIQERDTKVKRKRRLGRRGTIFSDTLGDPSEAPVQRKTLLGG